MGIELLHEFVFTNAGATGRFGPTQAQINTEYKDTFLEGFVTSIEGVQVWTVPFSDYFNIEIAGAGRTEDSAGAIITGTTHLKKGDILYIAVGQQGGTNNRASAGSGGTYIAIAVPNGEQGIYDRSLAPFIIAGGGGGTVNDYSGGVYGQTTTWGSASTNEDSSSTGGTDGANGSSNSGYAGFGAGYNFIDNPNEINAKSFLNGCIGGLSNTTANYIYHAAGGFGGGGFAVGRGRLSATPNNNSAGGGGGYSGGNGIDIGSAAGGAGSGGGGSYIKDTFTNIATSDGHYDNQDNFNGEPINIIGYNVGHGYVKIKSTSITSKAYLIREIDKIKIWDKPHRRWIEIQNIADPFSLAQEEFENYGITESEIVTDYKGFYNFLCLNTEDMGELNNLSSQGRLYKSVINKKKYPELRGIGVFK